MRVDVRDLVDRPASSRRMSLAEAFEGLRLELAWVADDEPVRGSLLLESVEEGILVSGRVTGRMHFSCARCLATFDGPFDIDVREMFAAGARPEDDEYLLEPEGEIDLEPMIRDAALLTAPFSPLCRPDCAGLCSRCGGDRNVADCGHSEETVDPRWVALEGLFSEEGTDASRN